MGMSIAQNPILVPHDLDSRAGIVPIPFQFTADGLTRDVSFGFAEASSLTRNTPILQFTRGQLKTIKFEARLFADSALVALEPLLLLLEHACERHEKLGRPPVWTFVWGSVVAPSVVVRTLGNIRYTSMRDDGTLRDVTLSIELAHYEPFSMGLTDPDARPHDTFYYRVKDGDLWETIAASFYGDALLGDMLRRRYPGQDQPVAGAVVKLPDRDKLDGISVIPESAQLRRTDESNALRAELFTSRSTGKQSTVLQRY